MAVQNLDKLTSNIDGISLFNIGLNAYGQIKQNKNVSVWTQGDNPEEVLVGNILNNTSKLGREAGEILSRSSVIIKASFSEPSKLCTHPIESGALITDHKVILPHKCTLEIAMPAYFQHTVIEELRKYFLNSTPLSVHDVSGVYNNMVITDMPHETTAKTAGRLVFNVPMEEVVVVAPVYVKLTKEQVKAKKHASTVPAGVKQGKTSILSDIHNSEIMRKFSQFIGGVF